MDRNRSQKSKAIYKSQMTQIPGQFMDQRIFLFNFRTGYKWRAAFNEVKFLYSMYDNWKLGFMCS